YLCRRADACGEVRVWSERCPPQSGCISGPSDDVICSSSGLSTGDRREEVPGRPEGISEAVFFFFESGSQEEAAVCGSDSFGAASGGRSSSSGTTVFRLCSLRETPCWDRVLQGFGQVLQLRRSWT